MSITPTLELCYRAARRGNYDAYHIIWFLHQIPAFSFPLSIGVSWALITGSPVYALFATTLFPRPSSPRPNAFWDHPRRKPFSDTTHPTEAMVYSSLTASLRGSLFRLLKSHHLGMVSENSFFLFINEPAVALVHIIAIDPTRVTFQLRGAEFCLQTLCHQSELLVLVHLAGYEYFWHLNTDVYLSYWGAAYRPIGDSVSTLSYETTMTSWSAAFVSLDPDDCSAWLFVSLCHFWFNDSANVARLSGLPTAAHDLAPLYRRFCERYATASCDDSVATERIELHEALVPALVAQDVLAMFARGPLDDGGAESPLLRDAFRFGLLLLALAASLLAPNLETEQEQVLAFVEETEREYAVVAPDARPEIEGRSLFSLVELSGHPAVTFHRFHEVAWRVFAYERDVARCLWATEAVTSVFWHETCSERPLIQAHTGELHNLIVQLSDVPSDYPAYVSEITASDADVGTLFG
jgi:hypothetical protein